MLLPLLAGMPIPVAAEGAVGTKPFVALTWSDIEEDIQAYDNANEMHTIHILLDKTANLISTVWASALTWIRSWRI